MRLLIHPAAYHHELPISEPERARREARYRAYLRTQSLIPLPEGQSRTAEPATPQSQEPMLEPANSPAAEQPKTTADAPPDPPSTAE